MARIGEPYIVKKRGNSFQFTLNSTCGLPERVCAEWQRRGFRTLPDELSDYRNPKTKPEAKESVRTLIDFLKKRQAEGCARRVSAEDITVGDWIKKFTELTTNPRTGINASKNRPFSCDTLAHYADYYRLHVKDDSIADLKMVEVEEDDILEYIARLSASELKDKSGRKMGGTRKFVLVVSFMRTAFNAYQKKYKRLGNPFQYIEKPKYYKKERDALTEDEMLELFMPGVLKDTTEFAVCAVMFLAGLRRAEVSALKPDDLDWVTPKIVVRRSWQMFNNKTRVMGPTKGKKARDAPFDPVLQNAIKKLWAENGKGEYVFSLKNGKAIGPSWIKGRFPQWLKDAGIELGGREIVPHSSRHSLASMLEAKGVSLRYIQELLGHSDLKTTKGYLHSTEKTIRDIGQKITETRETHEQQQKENPNIIKFKVS
jgi:integrase/recombinase XerD